MAYATQDDIADVYGEDILTLVADAEDLASVDERKMQRGLDEATAIINGYIGRAVSLPLASTPNLLRTICIDITVYRMCLDNVRRSDEMRQRYEDALKMLENIAKGIITLAEDETDENAVQTRAWIGEAVRS